MRKLELQRQHLSRYGSAFEVSRRPFTTKLALQRKHAAPVGASISRIIPPVAFTLGRRCLRWTGLHTDRSRTQIHIGEQHQQRSIPDRCTREHRIATSNPTHLSGQSFRTFFCNGMITTMKQ